MMLRGTPLSIAEASPKLGVQTIRIEMLPLQHTEHLENHADNFGAGWMDRHGKQLRLQFQLVVLFSTANTNGFYIAVPGGKERISLAVMRRSSPRMGVAHPDIAWSAQSRFVVDETVNLPDWAVGADSLELLADVGDRPRAVASIHIDSASDIADGNRNIALIPVSSEQKPVAPNTVERTWKLLQRIVARVKGMNRLFLWAVVVPTSASILYFGLIASDVYISESTFVVRGAEQQMASPLGQMLMLKGAGFSPSQDDSYAVQNFIMSRDALRTLDDRMRIRKAFSDNQVDIFSRFAGLSWDDSFEALYLYYQNKVDVQLDGTSSVVTLDTRAFNAEDSYKMNQMLLDMSEALVNQLSDRGRQDMINFAVREVVTAEQKDREATLALAKIQTESTKAPIGNHSLASKFTEYQRVALEKDIADKMLATALSSLEEARNQALRKQLYLERIAEPRKPDTAMEPKRLRSVLAVFVLGLVAWGVLSMLIAGIREHRE